MQEIITNGRIYNIVENYRSLTKDYFIYYEEGLIYEGYY